MEARNIHAGLPITDDDAAIAAALEDVSIPTLVLSLVHITGDHILSPWRLVDYWAWTKTPDLRDFAFS